MAVDLDVAYAAAYQALRALKVGEERDWWRCVAGDLPEGRHTVDVGGGRVRYRTLHRPEVFWWARGVADGYGAGHLVEAVTGEAVPELVTTQQAAKLIPPLNEDHRRKRTNGITVHGMEYLIGGGGLYPVYARRRDRRLFALQVDAVAAQRRVQAAVLAGVEPPARLVDAADTAHRVWMGLRVLLPAATREQDAGVDLTPAPSPDPWPVPPVKGSAGDEASRHRRALLVGHKQNWFTFEHRDTTAGVYVVTVTGRRDERVRLELPPAGVLPWVLGVADRHNRSRLVAYRDGLG